MPSRKKRKRYRLRTAATASGPGTCGGWGQGLPTSRSDLVLLRKAINQDWPVPDNVRLAIVGELNCEIGSPDGHWFLAVARSFVAMEAANIRDENLEIG